MVLLEAGRPVDAFYVDSIYALQEITLNLNPNTTLKPV
jgi:hypothetical protein